MPGGALSFLSTKSWHTSTIRSQKAVFDAEEEANAQARKDLARNLQLKKERKREADAKLLAAARGETHVPRVDFLYDDRWAGGKKAGALAAAAARANGEDTEDGADGADGADDADGCDAATRAVLGKPRPEDTRSALEKEAGVSSRRSATTLGDLQERFPSLKGAPTANRNASKSLVVNFKPLGKVLKNTKCKRCGEWGHYMGDRECPLAGIMSDAAEAARAREDPLPPASSMPPPPPPPPPHQHQQQQQPHHAEEGNRMVMDLKRKRKHKKHSKKASKKKKKKKSKSKKKKKKRRRRARSSSSSSSDTDSDTDTDSDSDEDAQLLQQARQFLQHQSASSSKSSAAGTMLAKSTSAVSVCALLLMLLMLCNPAAAGTDADESPTPPRPSTANCSVRFVTQPLDHFAFNPATAAATYQQRFYVYDDYFVPGNPVFFYTGNEADVGLYVNATGLMWENAEAFGALIVFAEHRYYGASLPAHWETDKSHLSHELALADFAGLVAHIRATMGAADSPFIAFGGSYGGKLAAWMRSKYPAAVEGAISASAPLLAFRGEHPDWDSQAYYRVITRTAASYSTACANNVKAVFPALDAAARTARGRAGLGSAFSLCAPPADAYETSMLKYFVRDAWDTMSMGNYPFPSNYISFPYTLPAYPVGLACAELADPALAKTKNPSTLFAAVSAAVSVLYNVSGTETCFDLPKYPDPARPGLPNDGQWDWQWCTELLPDSFWFSTDGQRDMFWPNEYNATLIAAHCEKAWGVTPRTNWIANEYGGRALLRGHSNLVFSSGSYDGWSSGGIATNVSARDITSLMVEGGGHHLDLMFSHPNDPPSVKAVRAFELAAIKRWIAGYDGRVNAKSWGDDL